jgi:hypothetical protein
VTSNPLNPVVKSGGSFRAAFWPSVLATWLKTVIADRPTFPPCRPSRSRVVREYPPDPEERCLDHGDEARPRRPTYIALTLICFGA